nr:hypothetical protein [Chryseobacterium sp. 7]
MAIHKKKDGTGGIGLQNVQKRLKLQYPDCHDLKIETNNNVFKVTLILKLSDHNE